MGQSKLGMLAASSLRVSCCSTVVERREVVGSNCAGCWARPFMEVETLQICLLFKICLAAQLEVNKS